MRINLLKRIESSLDSFRITLQGVLDQVNNFIRLIDKQVDGVIDVGFDSEDDIADFDIDSDWGDEENVIGKKIKIRLSDVDKTRWKKKMRWLIRKRWITYYRKQTLYPPKEIISWICWKNWLAKR